jgi:hypothetical protein
MLLKDVLVVGVTSEHSLVVHDVQSLTAFIFFWDWRVHHSVLGPSVFVLVSDNLRLSTFK